MVWTIPVRTMLEARPSIFARALKLIFCCTGPRTDAVVVMKLWPPQAKRVHVRLLTSKNNLFPYAVKRVLV